MMVLKRKKKKRGEIKIRKTVRSKKIQTRQRRHNKCQIVCQRGDNKHLLGK